jgi:hypothetical protein
MHVWAALPESVVDLEEYEIVMYWYRFARLGTGTCVCVR